MIKLASPDIRPSDIKKAIAVLKSGNLVAGEKVELFEKKLGKFMGLPYCLAVSSGTAALHLALLALKLGKGDGVIVPAFTFPATANVVEIVGAKTILSDVDAKTYVLSPQGLEKTILANKKEDLKAIIVVHEFGFPAKMKEISKIAQKYGLKIIEDAACALGSKTGGRHVGYCSDVACFSLHPRKALTTGEGGIVATRDKKIAGEVKKLRNHGIEIIKGKMDFTVAGLNYRLTDFQAALGLGQLERFSSVIKKRKKLAETYEKKLINISEIQLPQQNPGHSWQSYMVVLGKNINRQRIIEKMFQKGIQTNLGAQALNCLSYFKNKYHLKGSDFPIAKNLYKKGLVLPLYHQLTSIDINNIITKLKETLNE